MLVASTAPGLAIFSILANSSFLIGMFSNTASITMSASLIALRSVVGVNSARRFAMFSGVSEPRCTDI